MTHFKQRNIFLEQEGDNWFKRNKVQLTKQRANDPRLEQILLGIRDTFDGNTKPTFLEIGCGNGHLFKISKALKKFEYIGVDPSSNAVDDANRHNIKTKVGTADNLAIDDSLIDVLMFGFCLYLCDIEDLFRIAHEAHRVLKKNGWIIIKDFHSSSSTLKDYKHNPSIKTHKMAWKTMFDWHPDYHLFSSIILSHETLDLTDNQDDWISLDVIRKTTKR